MRFIIPSNRSDHGKLADKIPFAFIIPRGALSFEHSGRAEASGFDGLVSNRRSHPLSDNWRSGRQPNAPHNKQTKLCVVSSFSGIIPIKRKKVDVHSQQWRTKVEQNNNITCLVTLHGVGFQQPPLPGKPDSGYADLLHEYLKECLPDLLSDDPERSRARPGENGVIYVQSKWRNHQEESREIGLSRLDPTRPLVAGDEAVAHLALVYSNLEEEPPKRHVSRSLITLGMACSSFLRYGTIQGLTHLLFADSWAMVRSSITYRNGAVSSLPRTDWEKRFPRYLKPFRSTLLALEDDVACYVCDNDERERVRSFVAEALHRLLSRPDVGRIIFNTHSNGTVIGLDVLRHLSAEDRGQIACFVTAGSPLRKYVRFFSWGHQIIQTADTVESWYNFLDRRDPVADPLRPPVSWRVGQGYPSQECPRSEQTLFSRIDPASGRCIRIGIEDCPVNNVKGSPGRGLRAHDYWDNRESFVPELAFLVRDVVNNQYSPDQAEPLRAAHDPLLF